MFLGFLVFEEIKKNPFSALALLSGLIGVGASFWFYHLLWYPMKKIHFVLCLVGLFGALGCNELVAPDLSNYPDTEFSDSGDDHDTADVQAEDATQDEDADASTTDDVDHADTDDVGECSPKPFECSDTFCGPQANNCGEPVVCEPCGCTELNTSCGLGMLGIDVRCSVDGLPDEFETRCAMPEIPGLTEELAETALLYVNQATTSDTNDGKRDTPFRSIQQALAHASESISPDTVPPRSAFIVVIVAGDNQTVYESTAVELLSGVSLIGGYDSDFKRVRHNRPTIQGSARETAADKSLFGLVAEEITHPTVVQNFHITTQDATSGASAYAIYASAADGLVLDNVTTKAGKGGNGTAGTPGAPGNNGAKGQNSIWQDGKFLAIPPIADSSTPGVAGVNTKCPTHTAGGAGGKGATDSKPATAGFPAGDGAQGGKAGASGANVGHGGNGETSTFMAIPGPNGTKGVSAGLVINQYWVPTNNAGEGMNGTDGRGGGGGGGGIVISGKSLGNSGGGGGAGGCAGTGGKAGKPGGASFGLFLVDSPIKIRNSMFQASAGGTGGNGGIGGSGGKGGDGGVSADQHSPYGGNGGAGSAGSAGGYGGAGAGGASYGAYCLYSTPTLDGVIFRAGASAPGGQGPTAEESGGNGIAEDSFGCTP